MFTLADGLYQQTVEQSKPQTQVINTPGYKHTLQIYHKMPLEYYEA